VEGRTISAEQKRLKAQREGTENWRLWGPYLAERAWGTVREDYSKAGTAWEYFPHDHARSRVYRWNEDGLGGICDEEQRLCLALSLWNGRDPILKERAYGLSNHEGNHGEDVKEYYFYPEATPSHSYLRYVYKYPQAEYPYDLLLKENGRRTREDAPFGLLDCGVFDGNRYWDVEVEYAKADPETILIRITARNRGPEAAILHLVPTLWLRNDWSWEEVAVGRPVLASADPPGGSAWMIKAKHPTLGTYHFLGERPAELLFTENETNFERLWGVPNGTPYVKDAFNRRIVHGEELAVNPKNEGTKFAAWSRFEMGAGDQVHVDLLLTARAGESPFWDFEEVMAARRSEARAFCSERLPGAPEEDIGIFRSAIAGMIWNKQFYHYDVNRWLDGDLMRPPIDRRSGRNHLWRHLNAMDIISMPDTWEYPWFAAWDLAFHCAALTLVDIDFAKEQLELLLEERYMHPNGEIPGYEWGFGEATPPLQAWAALECFRAESEQRGSGDFRFLRRVFNKLLMNYGWWLNRKDPENRNVFEGGFMGMDNVSVYDRSRPLPAGYQLVQADATGWMAMFALNLTAMALQLATVDGEYEDMAIHIHSQFFAIANAVNGNSETGVSLWDSEDQFFEDAIVGPNGATPLHVFSLVGLIPLFACEIVGPQQIAGLPRYSAFLSNHAGGVYENNIVCACPDSVNPDGEHLFALVLPANLAPILRRVLNEGEFLSPHGVRSLSRIHASRTTVKDLPMVGRAMINYEPGESESGLFGGNSNWRGPVWFPLNLLLIRALDKFHRYLGEGFTVPAPCLGGEEITLKQAADLISGRLIDIFRRDSTGLRPAFDARSPFQTDVHWKDLLLFHEYFHGETGRGLGACHQTGWTALVANLLRRRYAADS
jgi:hypothetical protein